MLLIIFIIYIILSLIIGFNFYNKLQKHNELNFSIQYENKKLETINLNLKQYNDLLNVQNNRLINQQKQELKRIEELKEVADNTLNSQTELARKAFENYCDILDKDYQEKEKEHQENLSLLKESYEKYQLNKIAEAEIISQDLEKIRSTRKAAIEAQKKEKEIKEKLAFYCLPIKSTDKHDILLLNEIKDKLSEPRILNMLIWQTYFQKPMTSLCNNVLGVKTICGIYKITNQLNDMCYIGQSVDIATRWKSHAKCGLGIDTPAGNKLYKAMLEEGIWNFSWELLEECPKTLLDEKEKYYIDLYSAKDFGYNSSKGNN